MIERTASWARERGLAGLTLTTYVDVQWNSPYYERLGFWYFASEDETPELQAIWLRERAQGLDAWPRACMRRNLAPRPLGC